MLLRQTKTSIDILRDRSVSLDARLSKDFGGLPLEHRMFVVCMVASQSKDQGESTLGQLYMPRFSQSYYYGGKNKFYRLREELIRGNVICKLGNRYGYCLNPLFHPNLSKGQEREIEQGITNANNRIRRALI